MIYFRRRYFSSISGESKDYIEKEFMKLDFYSMLQVKHNANTNEIRKNYFEMAKVFHPDKYKGPSSIFKKLSEGYNILKDPVKREEYNKKLKIKQTFKYKSQRAKQKSKEQGDIYGGVKSKYEEEFKKINIDRLFGQFITSPIKTSPKSIRIFKPILERKMSKREYKIHEIMNQMEKEEIENRNIASKFINLVKEEEEVKKQKTYDELSKEAIKKIKYGDTQEKEKVEKEKEIRESSSMKLEYLFYSAAFLYICSFFYIMLRKKNQAKKEALNMIQRQKINEELRQMNYLYPNLPKK